MVTATDDAHPLDDPVGASLAGPHAHLARRHGRVATYVEGAATFTAVPADAGADDWTDLASLLGPGALADLFSAEARPPASWEPVFDVAGLQLVGPAAPARPVPRDPGVVTLGPDDVADMLDLVALTRPGPLWPRSLDLGDFLGVRHDDGRLVAMAGTRLHPPGWREVSAVCCSPEARGQGLASVLLQHLEATIRADGERPFLHVVAGNPGALRLYEGLGWTVRRPVRFRGYRVPG